MQFTATKEQLLPALKKAVGVIDNRNTMPILANVLLNIDNDTLTITSTDLEIQIVSKVQLIQGNGFNGAASITVPAKKLFDIVSALPNEASIKFKLDDNGKGQKLKISSGRSRYTLSTLMADDYPKFQSNASAGAFTLDISELENMLSNTSFSMANGDIRYYLNGLNISINNGELQLVGSDGHRLGISKKQAGHKFLGKPEDMNITMPRKAVLELQKLVAKQEGIIECEYSRICFSVNIDDTQFSTMLIDSKYPEFDKVLKQSMLQDITVKRDLFKSALTRVSILSNEKFHGIELGFDGHLNDNGNAGMILTTNNPENEEADEEVEADYIGTAFDIAFNSKYMIEAVSHIESEDVILSMAENLSCVLVKDPDDDSFVFVIMPMRL